jgi:hypothetical protein
MVFVSQHPGSKSLGSTLMAKHVYQIERARVLKHFILKCSFKAPNTKMQYLYFQS